MTTTVKKGTGRPAATARKTKAAQKVNGATREMADAMSPSNAAARARAAQKALPLNDALRMANAASAGKPADDYDSMSLAEVRRLAVAAGWSTGTKGSKRDIIALLRKHPDGPPSRTAAKETGKARRSTQAKTGKAAPTATIRSWRPITPGLAGNGAAKAAHVASLLKAEGWKVKVDDTTLTSERGDERLTLFWTERGAYSAALSAYRVTPDSKPRKVLNVASARRLGSAR